MANISENSSTKQLKKHSRQMTRKPEGVPAGGGVSSLDNPADVARFPGRPHGKRRAHVARRRRAAAATAAAANERGARARGE